MISMQSGWWVLSAILAFYALVRTSDLERASVVTRHCLPVLASAETLPQTLSGVVSHEGRYDYRAWANPELSLEANELSDWDKENETIKVESDRKCHLEDRLGMQPNTECIRMQSQERGEAMRALLQRAQGSGRWHLNRQQKVAVSL